MKKLISLLAIVALLGSCKKEENKAPASTPTNQSKLFVVDMQSPEPQNSFFGYNLYLNGNNVASPIMVVAGDEVKVVVFNPLGNSFILKCNLDNVNVYPNSNYQYSDVTWVYICP